MYCMLNWETALKIEDECINYAILKGGGCVYMCWLFHFQYWTLPESPLLCLYANFSEEMCFPRNYTKYKFLQDLLIIYNQLMCIREDIFALFHTCALYLLYIHICCACGLETVTRVVQIWFAVHRVCCLFFYS